MATPTIARRLLAALRDYLTKRRHDSKLYAELRDCDPRMLKDIGLRWERGRLVPLNPEREPEATTRRHQADTRDAHETCPHGESRLT